MKAISLFSGMGGDTLGMVRNKINVVAFSEFKKVFRDTHDCNFKNCEALGQDVNSDITKIPDSEFKKYRNNVDIVFAGFPCQSFSLGGKRKLDDPRNTLFIEFVRVARLTDVPIIIGENVKGLLTKKNHKNQLYIDIITKEFEKLGYNVIYKLFKCHYYGIPQKRERLIILGIKTRYLDRYKLEFPKETTLKKFPNISHIIQFDMQGAMKIEKKWIEELKIPNECIKIDMKNKEKENNVHPYLIMKRDMKTKEYGNKTFNHLFSFGKRISPIHLEIVDIRNPCKTIICTYNHQPRLLVIMKNQNGYFVRPMTPYELKQIQTFPRSFQLRGTRKDKIIQIGNAVPPKLIYTIVKHVIS